MVIYSYTLRDPCVHFENRDSCFLARTEQRNFQTLVYHGCALIHAG